MRWYEALAMVGGSGVFAALAAVLTPLLLEKVRYRHKREDREGDTAAQIAGLRRDLSGFKTETAEQIAGMREDVAELKAATQAVCNDVVARAYIDIRRRALAAIRAGRISAKAKGRLLSDYSRYQALPRFDRGKRDASLDDIIATMKGLGVTVDAEDLE